MATISIEEDIASIRMALARIEDHTRCPELADASSGAGGTTGGISDSQDDMVEDFLGKLFNAFI